MKFHYFPALVFGFILCSCSPQNEFEKNGITFSFPYGWKVFGYTSLGPTQIISIRSETESSLRITIIPKVKHTNLLDHAKESSRVFREAMPEGDLTKSTFASSESKSEVVLEEKYSIKMFDGFEPRRRLYHLLLQKEYACYISLDSRQNPLDSELEALDLVRSTIVINSPNKADDEMSGSSASSHSSL